ncbi:MAG: SDR family NAD(P)-dependent oxidoreductase [bacterium]
MRLTVATSLPVSISNVLKLPTPDLPFTTISGLLQHRADTTPDRVAYTYLADGETESARLSYRELEQGASAIAQELLKRTAPGDRALLLFTPGLEFMQAFFGCLFAGVIAVPSYPPKRNRPDPRLTTIANDSNAKIVLTNAAVLREIEPRLENTPSLRALHWIATDTLPDTPTAPLDNLPAVEAADLAFLQYTSGSTADPKGVMVSHGNLLHNLVDLDAGWDHDSDSVMITWLPIFHDMGLIYGALMPLFRGFRCVMLPPASFLQRPIRWLEAISRFGGTHSAAPNFAYDLCVASTTPAQRRELNLKSWRLSLNAAEPVREHTLNAFNAAFADCGLSPLTVKPGFGLAEATLKVTALPRQEPVTVVHLDAARLVRHELVEVTSTTPGATAIIGCGWGQVDNRTLIVDPDTRMPSAPDRVGEIWFAGPSVAQGYWQREEASAETFRATTADGSGPWMRTGDLGFARGREVFVTGRVKDLIILRGLNHYPQDIELTVEKAHPSIRSGCTAAFSFENATGEALGIVIEIERTCLRRFDRDEVVAALREAVAADHDLAIEALVFIKPASIPKTSSGKIQRALARQRWLDGDFKPVATWSVDEGRTAPDTTGNDPADLEKFIVTSLAHLLKRDAARIDATVPFAAQGLDSLSAVELSGMLERHLHRALSPTLVYDFPHARALAAHLRDRPAPSEPAAPAGIETSDPIAVIGLGCRFPGASDVNAYWDLLLSGRDAITSVPSDRWDPAQGSSPGFGGFLESVDKFDAEFFGLSSREADLMDPQQRLLLETTWHAIEHAGIDPLSLAGSQTGVFIGISTHDYRLLLARDAQGRSAHTGTGNALSIAANRLSYQLDLRGPSMAVDTACSSSLVALHHAVQSLRSGATTMAIAGGVNLMLTPDVSESFAAAGMLAPDGRCKTFDASADGYVRGEGVGIVVLKRLSAAQRDGDTVLAVVRGSAVNQDGRSNGLTAPNGPAQQAVITSALQDATLSAPQISFVESHGTGTALGDPIEANALHAVLQKSRALASRCHVGAVKTQIGHLEAAAGIAGFIKTVLALHHRTIPANLHLENPNPLLAALAPLLQFPKSPVRWDATERFAGVSSFGFGGTNAHVVVSSAPLAEVVVPSRRPVEPYILSARSPSALVELIEKHRPALQSLEESAWASAAFTATEGRASLPHRVAIVADTPAQAAQRLSEASPTAPPSRPPRIAFLFSGQGSLYAEAGKSLRETQPVFAAAFAECRALTTDLAGWDVAAALDDAEKVVQTEYAQVALFALEYSLARLWQSWGLKPTAVAGHSVGEYAAAVIAGVMSLPAALKLLITRARLMGNLGEFGAMAAVIAPAETVEALAATHGAEIGGYNSPRQTVITGTAAAVAATTTAAKTAGFRVAPLTVKQGYHSAEMEPMLADFNVAAAATRFQPATLAIVSSCTGAPAEADMAEAAYWTRQIRQPVRWADAARAIATLDCDLVIEVGPRNLLASLSAQSWPDQPVTWLTSLQPREADWTTLLGSVTAAWSLGAAVNWTQVHHGFERRRLSLPLYPFQRHRHWFTDSKALSLPSIDDRTAASLAADPTLTVEQKTAIPALLAALKRLQRSRPAAAPLTHEIQWRPQPRKSEATAAEGRWLVIGSAESLVAELSACRQSTTTHPNFRSGQWTGVVHVVSDASPNIECHRLLDTIQSLTTATGTAKLYLITRGAVATAPMEGRSLQLAHAAALGMGLAFGLEQPDRWGGVIDLPPIAFEAEGAAVAAELLGNSPEDQVALRPGRFVPRLVPAAIRAASTLSLSADASYWITGGLGGVGLQTARWFIARGAKHVILSGRSEASDTSDARLAELSRTGATVRYEQMDVSDLAAVTALLDDAESTGHPVRGIIHAAGVLHNQPIAEVTPATVDAVLRPKVQGGLRLHEATMRRDLDFLVFYSSIASVWGSKWQLHYSAANRFLDALAVHRRATALPALAINWGPWSGGGMAGKDEQQLLARMGITAGDSSVQLDLLGDLLDDDRAQCLIADVDWAIFRSLVELQRPKPLLAELAATTGSADTTVTTGPSALVTTWTDLEVGDRIPAIQTWLQGELATTLGLKSNRLPDPSAGFFDLGIDSLLAVEFRNRLVAAIGQPLPTTLAFDHGNTTALAAYIFGKLWSPSSAPNPTEAGSLAPPAPPAIAESASADDIEDALTARLARLEALTRDA